MSTSNEDLQYRVIAEQGDLGLYDEVLSEADQRKVRIQEEGEK